MGHPISTTGVVQGAHHERQRCSFHLGNFKGLEIFSQELGTRASQILYYTEIERTRTSSHNIEKEQI